MASHLARLLIAGSALTSTAWAQSPAPAPAEGDAQPAPARSTPGLRATQVTLAIPDGGGKGRVFRATVMARKDDVLTVLTAAHCLSAGDADLPVRLVVDDLLIQGTVASVVRNPAYKESATRDYPGADNAIARFRFKPEAGASTEAFEALKPAVGLASRIYPGPSGQVIPVRMIDQKGVEHAVKAGNFSNPRVLEWGRAYKPIPGDSGSGVFVMSGGADGQPPRPVLIGILVSSDDRGGLASLVAREMRWIADELPR